MGEEIITKIIVTIVGFAVSGLLGFFIAKIKGDINQEKALKCLLRSNITKIYYNYTSLGEIPIFERENVAYLYAQYKAMKGNSYIDDLYPKIMALPVKGT